MRTLKRIAVLATILLAGTAQASDLDALEKKVAKYASTPQEAYKSPCVCLESGEFNGRAGALRYAIFFPSIGTREIRAWCQSATFFSTDGSPAATMNCQTFALLAK